ncbi:MAG TPA: hypothetical protein PK095_02430, partial [Myxococcota bacterium]|nr:hypothetical protein [Myxococcota bacterium]
VVLYDGSPTSLFGEDPPPAGAELVADCWRNTYGEVLADGSQQISVPTDGSPVVDEPCSFRAVRLHTRDVEDDYCYRTQVEPSEPYLDAFIRCCGDVGMGD